VHTDGSLYFPASPKQATQGEMQLDRLGIDFDYFDERLNGLVRLLVDQKVKASKVRGGKSAGLGQELLDVDACREPTQTEEDREADQPPELEFHALTPKPKQSEEWTIEVSVRHLRLRPRATLSPQFRKFPAMTVQRHRPG
jgi:hypothetical protein